MDSMLIYYLKRRAGKNRARKLLIFNEVGDKDRGFIDYGTYPKVQNHKYCPVRDNQKLNF